MKLETTFDIGQEVWHLFDKQRRVVERCSICAGAGEVPVVGVAERIRCPKCWGKGELESGEAYTEHLVSHGPITIGQVRVMVEGPTYGNDRMGGETDRSNMGPRSQKREEQYMAVETGVGSGRLYKVEDLFATKEEAQAVAKLRTEKSRDRIVEYDEVA